ncbi:Papain inhibitor [Sphaceloma murrayae]|uniref:Papain inhibitor n=1 Tax=Sphaceloma murrayae TaxID=2082308 RepID=A0A2K1QQL6_9PEZI|nr:Papain inhibitor [Sphaceloma murrayae]
MKATTISALTALLSTGALAVPMAGGHHAAPAHQHLHHRNKRDIVWETEWEIETVTVVKTVYDDGTEPAPTGYSSTSVAASATTTSTSYVALLPSSTLETSSSPAYTPPASSSQAPATTSSSTSTYVAPPAPTTPTTTTAASSTTTTEAPAPTTEATTPAPTTYSPPAPSSSPAAASSSQSSSGSGTYAGAGSTAMGAAYTGDATYWIPGLGACGWTNTDTEDVVAISHLQFDTGKNGGDPNANKLCGRNVSIKTATGNTVTAKVVDRCVGCLEGDLDMTLSLFNKVTNYGDGRVKGMEWSWA